ncbi:MAG TPA: prenyltransferase/squalene oxidase repeat-containing protein [Pseudonocardiaceae bacterium]
MHSRVLESALALRLLERTDSYPERQAALTRYLRAGSTCADPLDRLVASTALDRTGVPSSELLDQFLAQAPDFTSSRKRAMLDGIFALWGHRPAGPWRPGAFSLTGLHCWATVQVTALKVVLAECTGHHDAISDEDVRLLLETQRDDRVWESNVLLYLWTLHALTGLPGTAQVVADGVRRVMAHQRPDGGMPFVSDTDTWCTATAGVALAASGAPQSMLRRLAAHLVAQQQPGGGWSYTDHSHQTDVDDTSVALQFLQGLDDRDYREPIARGMRSLYAVRGSDGGFPTYVAGSPSEASMTAAALDALTVRWQQHSDIMMPGLEFLAEQQNTDGSFPPDWSSSRYHTIFRALLVAGRNPDHQPGHVQQMIKRAMTLLWEQQNTDGGWGQQDGSGSDPISTAYAVIALCGQDDPVPAAEGLRYLLAHQRADGGIDSVPDSIGPRPFIFAIPALADIFTLLAFGHLGRRLQRDPS